MQIHVQLFSILRDCLPPGTQRGQTNVTLADGATLADLITHLGVDENLGFAAEEIAAKARWQVLVSDKFEADMGRVLRDGDEVKILPPISGG